MSTSSYHHGDLRNVLLSAAERMIDADVTRQFSMRELAREARVSHAAPYKHFADRGQLVLALASRWMADFVDAQESAVMAEADPRARLQEAGVAYVMWAADHPSRFTTIFDPALNQGVSAEGVGAHVERHVRLLRRLVDDAVAAGDVSGEPEVAGRRLWSVAHGLAGLVVLGHIDRAAVPVVLLQAIH